MRAEAAEAGVMTQTPCASPQQKRVGWLIALAMGGLEQAVVHWGSRAGVGFWAMTVAPTVLGALVLYRFDPGSVRAWFRFAPDPTWAYWVCFGLLALLVSLVFIYAAVPFGLAHGDRPMIVDLRRVVYHAAVAPCTEELAYRGVIMGALLPVAGRRVSIVFTSVSFALVHLSGGHLPVNVALSGIFLSWVRVRSGTLWLSALFHLLGNVLVLATHVTVARAEGLPVWEILSYWCYSYDTYGFGGPCP